MVAEPLAKEDVGAAAGVLARAFRDNPAMVAVLRGDPPEIREKILAPCMAGFAEAVRRYGQAEVVKDGSRPVAVSLAFPPGRFPPPLLGQLVGAKGPLLAGPKRALAFARIDYEMRRRHPHFSHWYLWILGVEPEYQGRGLGSVLLRSMSAHAAGDSVSCYLETDKASSVRIYEKHGYQVTSEETLRSFDLKLWFMTKPKSG